MLLHILGWRRGAYSYGGKIIYLASGILEMSDGRGGGASGGTAAGGRRGGARTAGRTERIAADAAVGHFHVMMLSMHAAGNVSQVLVGARFDISSPAPYCCVTWKKCMAWSGFRSFREADAGSLQAFGPVAATVVVRHRHPEFLILFPPP